MYIQPRLEADAAANSLLPELPLFAYNLVALALPHEDLPSLRLVSREWCEAANKAVRRFSKEKYYSAPAQLDDLRIAVQKFTGLSKVNMLFTPPHEIERHLETLLPLSSLQTLVLYHTAAEGAAAWTLVNQQTCLTCLLYLGNLWGMEGVQDGSLLKLSGLQTLVQLDVLLSTSATELGIRSLSQLTNLRSLRLPVSENEAGVSDSAVTAFQNLTQLTFLALPGRPITELAIISMACLSKLQRINFSHCERLTCLCFMPLLQFPCLHTIEIERDDEWLIDPIVAMFQMLRPAIALKL